MHAQVTRVQVQPGKLNDVISIIRDSVVPVAREQKGYRGAYALVDREMNKAMMVSLWETQADLAAIVASGFYQEQVSKFLAHLTGPPEREVYEVGLQA